ncbi:MAG: hypothetical protein ACREIC_20870, partial [Limisphaerales bacterium]
MPLFLRPLIDPCPEQTDLLRTERLRGRTKPAPTAAPKTAWGRPARTCGTFRASPATRRWPARTATGSVSKTARSARPVLG